ncbi:MAG: hypothetical protein FD138_2932, partial [Planctomycetota bacterium]
MSYEAQNFKVPVEAEDYSECSAFVIEAIKGLMTDALNSGRNKILIHTNLKLGLPMENINKVAGPFVEAWAVEVFQKAVEDQGNKYRLINVEAQERLNMSDVILQFKRQRKRQTATSETSRDRPDDTATAITAVEPWLQVLGSREFPGWLSEQNLSIGFTTYQAGKLILLGLQPDRRLAVFERTFNRCMGLCGDGQTLWMSALFQLWRFENALAPGETYNGCDRLFVPKVGYTTGDLDIHDVAVEASGRVVFVNTKFGCLATLDERTSFKPLWRPSFLSKLAPEDRCHL